MRHLKNLQSLLSYWKMFLYKIFLPFYATSSNKAECFIVLLDFKNSNEKEFETLQVTKVVLQGFLYQTLKF